MVPKIALYTIAGAMLIANVQPGEANSLTGLTRTLQLPPGAKQFLPGYTTPVEPSYGSPVRSTDTLYDPATLIAYDPFDANKFKTTFDRDPQFFAQATRMDYFWQFLVENDLIGMPQDKVVEMLGQGQTLEDSHATAAENKSSADPGNGRDSYLIATKITGAQVVATVLQLEYKGGKVARWRFISNSNHYPITDPKSLYRVELVSHWVTQNVVESDICDFGRKIKKNLFGSDVDKSSSSFENTRPPFSVASQKVLPTTEEPIPLVFLPQQPTSSELLNAAVLTQQSLLVKAAREYAEQAVGAAKTDADRKKARAFIEARLPLKTPKWEIEKRHMESYAASKRNEPEAEMEGYEKNIRDEPSFEYSYYTVGMLKLEKRNFAGAQNMFEKALSINPKYQKAIFGLAAIKLQVGDSNAARKMALKAYFLFPYDNASKYMYHSITNEDPPEKAPADLGGSGTSKSAAKGALKKH
jgi:hypothetical protein